jgi:hypothetical protein
MRNSKLSRRWGGQQKRTITGTMFLGKKRTRHQHDSPDTTTTTRKFTKLPGLLSRWCGSLSMRDVQRTSQESDSTNSGSRRLPLDAAHNRERHQHTTRNKDIILGTAVHGDDTQSQGRYQCDDVDQGDMAALVWLSRLIESGQDDKHPRQHAIFATSIGRGAQKYRHQQRLRPVGNEELLDLSSAVRLTDSPAQGGQLGSRIAQVITHVTTLDLTGLGFDHFPEELLRLTSLRNLCMADNAIEELPAGIERLSLLERLVLRNNRLSSLPLELGHLENLRELCVCGNLIAHVPTAVGQPYRLPELRPLSFKKVSSAPAKVNLVRRTCLPSTSRLNQDREAKRNVKLVLIGDLASGKTDMAVTYIQVGCEDHFPTLWPKSARARGCERKSCGNRASHLVGRERAPSRRRSPRLLCPGAACTHQSRSPSTTLQVRCTASMTTHGVAHL